MCFDFLHCKYEKFVYKFIQYREWENNSILINLHCIINRNIIQNKYRVEGL